MSENGNNHSVTITAQQTDPVTTLRVFSDQDTSADFSLLVSLDAETGIYTADTDLPTRMVGTVDDDELVGGSGNDIILGNDGDDILDGGVGSDTLSGGAGDDLYRTSDGSDVILTGGGTDTLEIVEGYSLQSALLNTSNGSLTVTILDNDANTHTVVVENHNVAPLSTIRSDGIDYSLSVTLSNGAYSAASDLPTLISGTVADDTLVGYCP